MPRHEPCAACGEVADDRPAIIAHRELGIITLCRRCGLLWEVRPGQVINRVEARLKAQVAA